jgi:hypothetical protein
MFTTPTIINMLIVLKVRIRAFFNKRLQRNVGDVAARLPIMDVNVLIHGVVGWLGLRVPVTGHESWLS